MTHGHEEQGSGEPRPAGPVADDGGALRAGASSTPPSSAPPAGGAAPTGSSGQGDGDQVEQDLDALLADAEAKKDEYLELARRTQADFENFRKRMAAEVLAAGLRGKGQLAQEVVPALDDLERAIEAAGLDPEGDSEDGLAHGVLLVFRSLREGLKRNGIEAVDPKGEKFDPNRHEALSTLPGPEGTESGTVVEVLQKGYRMGEQLIRPARVVVSE
ncbi:MAG TPA: nucleotide exchange factor GrpE [Solirubrobacterales bacterium]|nr:nucleotide exchange factor GrpE [Solirubrobacterales bacterium]